MENKALVDVTENVTEMVETVTGSNSKKKLATKVGIGVGIAAGLGGLITLVVKKTENLRIKWATKLLEKNGKKVIDDEDVYVIEAEDLEPSLFDNE